MTLAQIYRLLLGGSDLERAAEVNQAAARQLMAALSRFRPAPDPAELTCAAREVLREVEARRDE
jgi:hypothetical protein